MTVIRRSLLIDGAVVADLLYPISRWFSARLRAGRAQSIQDFRRRFV